MPWKCPVRVVLAVLPLLLVDARVRADVAQWDFDGGLESTTGHDALLELATAGLPDFAFEAVDINGSPADVAHFSRGTYFDVPHGTPPNGGGGYVNQYTLIMDVMFPDRSPSGGWASLFQTNCCNGNDGDWFVNPDGAVGVSGNYGGAIQNGIWYRLALVVDLVAGTYTCYIDGVQVQQIVRPAIPGMALDDRFAIYSPTDTDPAAYETFFIFADGTAADTPGEDAEGFVNSVQFRDVALPPGEIANLGGPSASGIPIPTDPRDCSFRNIQVRYDETTNRVTGTWAMLPGENGFRVFQGARQIGSDLPPAATSFEDVAPPVAGVGVVYTLKPLRAGGAIERSCDAAPIDTFGCIGGLACCADQADQSVTLTWSAPVNVTVSGYSVKRNGAGIGTPGPAASSFTDGAVPAAGTHLYEVTVLAGGNPLCAASCRATVTGVPAGSAGECEAVINTYHFNGDLKSSTGGRDLIAMISPPIVPPDLPVYSFEDGDIGGQVAQVCRYSRGTMFRMFTGLGPNGGGLYTNQYTLILDVLFEGGAIDESGWAALYQTNEANANDGDWFIRGSDRGIGIDGNYGGMVADDEWHRLALVLDHIAGTFTSYIDGVKVQQNTGLAIDSRWSLYSFNDGDDEGISLFADGEVPSPGENSAGLVSSVQIRDAALSDEEVAAFGGPRASGIPPIPPCPHSLTCGVDQAAKSVTFRWNRGSGLPGDGFTLRRNGAALATLPLTADSYTDPGLTPGVYRYELTLNDRESGCINLPLTCQAEIVGQSFLFEDFEKYEDDAAFQAAGWEVRDVNGPIENASWTVENPARRSNPPTFNGRPSNGRFAISDSDYGGGDNAQNEPGSGMGYELWSPAFATTGANAVWLHFDASVQLNNNGDAVFQVDVSPDGGNSWVQALERVSPGRPLELFPAPAFEENADGLHGRVHLDLSAVAANKAGVRICFRHVEPTWDWWAAIDNVLVDSDPAGGPTQVLAAEGFTGGIPAAWRVVSGPGAGAPTDPWSTDDPCRLSLDATGGAFPDAADGQQLHHLNGAFALADPFCSATVEDEYLITPALNLAAHGRAFLHVRSAVLPTASAAAEILVSLDGGSTFLPAPIFSYNAGGLVALEEDPVFNELVLEAREAAGKPNVAFAFHYKTLGSAASPGTWWALDDVRVTGGPSGGRPVFHRGDADGSGKTDITDGIFILSYLFQGGPAPGCLEAANTSDEPRLAITSAIYILSWLFQGGPAPPPPGPPKLGEENLPCGPDPAGSPSDLGCLSYTKC